MIGSIPFFFKKVIGFSTFNNNLLPRSKAKSHKLLRTGFIKTNSITPPHIRLLQWAFDSEPPSNSFRVILPEFQPPWLDRTRGRGNQTKVTIVLLFFLFLFFEFVRSYLQFTCLDRNWKSNFRSWNVYTQLRCDLAPSTLTIFAPS